MGNIITGTIACADIKSPDVEVEATTGQVLVDEAPADLEVTVNRKEYTIIGDEVYIPKLYEDAPVWMQNLINETTRVAIELEKEGLVEATRSLNDLIAEIEVAKNTYTQSIISSNDIDSRINTAITTLNSELANADATILGIAQTAVTPEEARAITIDGISAQLENTDAGSLGATIADMNSALVTADEANATSINTLVSTIEGESDARAEAVNTINTYVGIDEAGASTGTGLSGYLEDPTTGEIGGAESQLNNTIKITSEEVESKFEYNSIVNINGVYKKSGFGLTTNYTSGAGTEANPYVSEFWIDASRLKFTNSNQTGQATPFLIDASGIQPEVTFNGKVTFGSGQTGTVDEAIAASVNTIKDYVDATGIITKDEAVSAAQTLIDNAPYVLPSEVANAINTNTTTINGSKITTGSIDTGQIAAGAISSDKISSYNLTTTNASIQNSFVTNAMIGNLQVTAAKIADGNITNAKIGYGAITTAKIGTAQIDTLRIAGEAVIVNRYASGTGSSGINTSKEYYSIAISYTPTVTHRGIILGYTEGGLGEAMYNRVYVNNSRVVSHYFGSNRGQSDTTIYSQLFYANTAYTIRLQAWTIETSAGDMAASYTPLPKYLILMGTKR